MLLDIIFLAIIIICVVWGAKRGIIKTALGLSSLIVSIALALWLYEPFMEMLSKSEPIANVIATFKNSLKAAMLPKDLNSDPDISGRFPTVFIALLGKDILSQGAVAVASAGADAVVYIITIVVFIIVIKLAVSFLFKVFNLAAKLPVIKQANGLVGGVLGLVVGIFACWVASAVLTMFIGQDGTGWIVQSVENSRLAKHLFSTNIIFSIFK